MFCDPIISNDGERGAIWFLFCMSHSIRLSFCYWSPFLLNYILVRNVYYVHHTMASFKRFCPKTGTRIFSCRRSQGSSRNHFYSRPKLLPIGTANYVFLMVLMVPYTSLWFLMVPYDSLGFLRVPKMFLKVP